MKADYIGCCVNLRGLDIQKMVDEAVEITRETFARRINTATLRDLFPHYRWVGVPGGVRLKDDWHVAYYRSKYRGKRCWFLDHSSIEYVFVRGDILGGVQ